MELLQNPDQAGSVAVSYTGRAQTIRNDRFRLISHRDGSTELYDHDSENGETVNVADQHPGTVAKLTEALAERLAQDR